MEHNGRRRAAALGARPLLVGSGPECGLRLAGLAKAHFRIDPFGDGWKLVDLGSPSGTRVNGVPVSQSRVAIGDRIDADVLQFQIADGTVDDEGAGASADDGGTAFDPLLMELRRTFGDDRGLEAARAAFDSACERVFGRMPPSDGRDVWRLIEITRALNSTRDPDALLTLILDAAVDMTGSERGFILLKNASGSWDLALARDFDHETLKDAERKVSHGIAEEVATSGTTVVTVDAQDDTRFSAFASVRGLRLRSILAVPLRARDRVIGTVYVDNRFKEGVYGEREQNLLETFADQAALALDNTGRAAREVRATVEEAPASAPDDGAVPARAALKHDYPEILGESVAVRRLLHKIDRIVESDLPVLVTGESGTGKELVARALHEKSPRATRAFVRENCAAIPENLLESELFGHVRGAFTGAHADKKGLFVEADGGTLFLDEIGELAPSLQAKLLRALQDGEIRPVGARESRRVDVRIVSATNRDLRRSVDAGTFREDLYFRLAVVTLDVPPLRERPDDVPQLVTAFLDRTARKAKAAVKPVDPAAMRALRRWHWPGNIRELQNEIARAFTLSGEKIALEDLSPAIASHRGAASPEGGLKEAGRAAQNQREREVILAALERCDWKKSSAARQLGISRQTLDQKIRLFGLTPFIERGKRR